MAQDQEQMDRRFSEMLEGRFKKHNDDYAKGKKERKENKSEMEKEEDKKLRMLQSIQIPDLIDSSCYVWTPQALESKQAFFSPGESINYFFPAGNYICNLAKSKYITRTIIKYTLTANNTARLLCVNSPKAHFHVTALQFDQTEGLDQQGERSRPIFNAVLNRFKDYASTRDSASMGKYDDLRFKMPIMTISTAGVAMNTAAADSLIMYVQTDKGGLVDSNQANKPMYYGNDVSTNATFQIGGASPYTGNDSLIDSFQSAYFYQGLEQDSWRKRYYSVVPSIVSAAAHPTLEAMLWTITPLQNVSIASQSITPGANERYTYIEGEFGDLAIECASLQSVPMCMFTSGIRLQKRLVEPVWCMSTFPRQDAYISYTAANPNVASGDVNMVFNADDSYVVCDVAVKLRNHLLMKDKIPLVKEIGYKTVYPYLTYAYRREPIMNNNQVQFNFTLNTPNFLGYFSCITGYTGVIATKYINNTTPVANVASIVQMNYNDDSSIGASMTRYEQDHYYIQTNRQYVQIDSENYSKNELMIPNRQLASYAEALSEASVLFPNRSYAVQPSEFFQNRYVYFTSVNNHAARGQNVKGKPMGIFMEFNQTGQNSQRILNGNYHVHFFFLYTKSLSFDMQKGIILE